MRRLLLVVALVASGCGANPAEPSADPASAPEARADASPAVPDTSEVAEPTDAPPWTAGILDLEGSDAQEMLRAVRSARHDGFDRMVFEFSEAVPDAHLEYIDQPVRACGSGEVVELPGDGWLEVRFSGARAHTEAGEATVGDRERSPDLPTVLALTLTCDFEGVVTWVAGAASPTRYRAFTLDAPARLVVDVQHGT